MGEEQIRDRRTGIRHRSVRHPPGRELLAGPWPAGLRPALRGGHRALPVAGDRAQPGLGAPGTTRGADVSTGPRASCCSPPASARPVSGRPKRHWHRRSRSPGWLSWTCFDVGNAINKLNAATAGRSLAHSTSFFGPKAMPATGVLASERRATMGTGLGLAKSDDSDKLTGGASSVLLRVCQSSSLENEPALVWDQPERLRARADLRSQRRHLRRDQPGQDRGAREGAADARSVQDRQFQQRRQPIEEVVTT